MARRGSFGRVPRAAPSLTSTILAIAREMESQRQQNIYDAWKNGGLVDGKPVTDDVFLSYLKERRDGYDKGDPAWDEWNNSLTQNTFGINEAKQNLAYQQGKITATQFAGWYRSQLSSIPKDSAFYREVAGRAAQWAKSAVGSARGAANKRVSGYLDGVAKATGATVAQFGAMTDSITIWARQSGFITGTQKLTDIQSNSVDEFMTAFNAENFMYDGKPLTFNRYQQYGKDAIAAQGSQIAALDKNGKSSKEVRSQRSTLTQTLGLLGAFDERGTYDRLTAQFQDDVAAAHNDPARIKELIDARTVSLAKLRDQVVAQGEAPDVAGALADEIVTLQTGEVKGGTVTDRFDNPAAGVSKVTGDAEATAADVLVNQKNYELLATGQGWYGQLEKGAEYTVNPNVPNPTTGEIHDDNQIAAIIVVNGKPQQVWLTGAPISGVSLYENTLDKNGKVTGSKLVANPDTLTQEELYSGLRSGKYTQDDAGTTVGYAFETDPYNGPQTKHWGSYDANGNLTISKDNPFDNGPDSGHAWVGLGGKVIGDVWNDQGQRVNGYGQVVGSPVIVDERLTVPQLQTIVGNLKAAGDAVNATAFEQELRGKINESYFERRLVPPPFFKPPPAAVSPARYGLVGSQNIKVPNLPTLPRPGETTLRTPAPPAAAPAPAPTSVFGQGPLVAPPGAPPPPAAPLPPPPVVPTVRPDIVAPKVGTPEYNPYFVPIPSTKPKVGQRAVF